MFAVEARLADSSKTRVRAGLKFLEEICALDNDIEPEKEGREVFNAQRSGVEITWLIALGSPLFCSAWTYLLRSCATQKATSWRKLSRENAVLHAVSNMNEFLGIEPPMCRVLLGDVWWDTGSNQPSELKLDTPMLTRLANPCLSTANLLTIMASQGRVQQVVVTNNATFDGTVYVFKNAGTYYLLGTIRVGERKTFPINVVQSGINNGDDIRARILSTQGAENTDSVLVTYVSNSGNQAEYIVSGTAGDPKINFTAVAPMPGGTSPPPELRRVRQVTVTNRATFDGTVYIFKNAGTYYLLGSIRVGETQTFPINDVQSGVNNGDDIRTRILSSQGADNTDSTLVTYVSNANFEARYIVDGTAGNPTIRFVSVNPL